MPLIEVGEIRKIKDWAVTGSDNSLFHKNTETDTTFWVTREREDTYIMEYDFGTLPEFESLCKEVVRTSMDEHIQRIVSVAVFKNVPQERAEYERQEGIPEYRYTF